MKFDQWQLDEMEHRIIAARAYIQGQIVRACGIPAECFGVDYGSGESRSVTVERAADGGWRVIPNIIDAEFKRVE